MKKSVLKKVTGIIFALCIIFSVGTVSAFADDSLDTSVLGLTSSSNYVRVLTDSILVMSHYDDTRYYIRSDAGKASDNDNYADGNVSFGLFSVLSSSEGYTLSYVDADKNVPDNAVASVKDGYVLCRKDGENDIYVPIVCQSTPHVFTSSGANFGAHSKDGVISYGEDKSGIGGKPADDKSRYISVGETMVTAGVYPRYEYFLSSIVKDGNDNTCDEPFTFETNIYADGDAVMQFAIRTYVVLQWRANGEVWGMNSTSAAGFSDSAVKLGELERGKWHRLTIGYDLNRERVVIYADGVRLTNSGSRSLGKTGDAGQLNNTLRIGLGDTSVNGTIAMDDIIGYKGHYYPDDDIINVYSPDDDTLKIDTDSKSIAIDTDAYSDVQLLKTAILSNSNASDLRLLKSDFSDAADVSDIKVCMLVSSSGNAYDYYSVSPFFSLENLEFVSDGTKVGATASFSNMLSDAKTVTMILVVKNSAGAIEQVYSSDTISVETDEDLSIEPVETAGGDVCVFFVDNWSSRTGIMSNIYTHSLN